jgi:putative ABC transport system permease protein
VDSAIQDLRYAVRGLLRSPGFTAIAVLTLALGTGANAAVFSFVNALLLQPPSAVSHPGELVSVFTSDFSSGPYGQTSYPDFVSLARDTDAFASLAAYEDVGRAVITAGDIAEMVRVSRVSGQYFHTLGLAPAHGRLLAHADMTLGPSTVAVISHRLWLSAFGGNPDHIGRTARLAGVPLVIAGVAPRGFESLRLGQSHDVWVPISPSDEDPLPRDRRGLEVIGRLRSGVTLDQAQAQVSALAAELARAHPETNRGTLQDPDAPRPMVVRWHTRLHPSFRGEVGALSVVLMATVGLVLLIACGNVAALLLSRATARAREMAVRLALGAGTRRLMRQLLVESLVLAALGGAFGLLFALWTVDVLPSFFPPDQARLLAARVDMRVAAFTALVAGLSSLAFGLAPALQAVRPSAASALRADDSRAGDSRVGTRLRRLLVAAQIALAFVLMVSASLLTRSLSGVLAADLGFATRSAALASIELPPSMAAAEAAAYFDRLLARIRRLPGVEAATLTRVLPLSGSPRRGFQPEGYVPRPGEGRELPINIVDPAYFQTLGIPLLQGRLFEAQDGPRSARVAIVNEPLAERYFGGRAVGRTIRDSWDRDLQIVGVVGAGPPRSPLAAAQPMVYYPLAQEASPRLTLVARTSGDPRALIASIRREAAAVDPRVPVFRPGTLEGLLDEALTTDRLMSALVNASALMALLLALIGVYGVIAYGVGRRTREIGVRMALGAARGDLLRLVLGEGAGVTLAGIAIGGVAAAAAARGLEALLPGVKGSDPIAFAVVPLALLAAALLAAWIPARRALALEPSLVLRQD